MVKVATLAVFALIAICIAIVLFVPDVAPEEETPNATTLLAHHHPESSSASEPRGVGHQWETDDKDKEEGESDPEPEDGNGGGVPLWRQAVARAKADAADAKAAGDADAVREEEDAPASLTSPVTEEEEEMVNKNQEEQTTTPTTTNVVESGDDARDVRDVAAAAAPEEVSSSDSSVLEAALSSSSSSSPSVPSAKDSTTMYLMERLQTLQGVKSKLKKMKDDWWVMAARAAGVEDPTPPTPPTAEPMESAAEPVVAGEVTDEKEKEEEEEEKQPTPHQADSSEESSEAVEGAQSMDPGGGDGADDASYGGKDDDDHHNDEHKALAVAVKRAVTALNIDNLAISNKLTHTFNPDIVSFARGEGATEAALLEAMKRRRDELWGDATPEAAAEALATGHPCVASKPAREFPSVSTCGNNGAADACKRVDPQPFAKNPLPSVTGQECTRALAATPAMSLLWLRPAAGGPRAAAVGDGDEGSGGGGGEDRMDPAVRAWATSTRGMIADLAAAAGSRFEALTSAGRHRMGALGPAEIVAFTDAAAPVAPATKEEGKYTSSSSSSSSSAATSTFTPAATAAHKDVDRALRKEILVNATHHHIYAMTETTDAVAFNRLATFAASEALLVVRGGEEASVSPGWVRAALVRMGADPTLSVIGVSSAATAAEGEEEENRDLDPDPTRVVLMRRSALVNAGQIPGAPCDGGVGGLSRSWAGFLAALRERGGTTLTLPASAGGPGVKALSEVAPPAAGKEKKQEEEEKAVVSAACSAPTVGRGCRPPPAAAVLVQYYKREHNIARLSSSVLGNTFGAGVLSGGGGGEKQASEAAPEASSSSGSSSGDVEFLVNNDSGSHHGKWLRAMAGCERCFLVHSPDVHEIRGYNRLARLTQAPILAFVQDDDAPRNGTAWLTKATRLMAAKPDLGLLGGKTGRVDPRGSGVEVKARRENVPGYIPGPTWQVDGPKFGRGHGAIAKRAATDDDDPATGRLIEYMTMYKVNASPLITRRAVFLRVGMFHPGFSCPGDAGIGFDFEYSVRLWYHGYAVGLYDAEFRDARAARGGGGGGDTTTSKGDRGTRRSGSVVRKRLQQWHRNNALMYYMYPGFHHKAAMRFVAAVAGTAPGGAKARGW